MYASPKQAAQYYGVSKETLRLWAIDNKIDFKKTLKGHRRYRINTFNISKKRISIIYARVSSRKQKNNLANQIKFLQDKFPNHELITDIASGINFKRKGWSININSNIC